MVTTPFPGHFSTKNLPKGLLNKCSVGLRCTSGQAPGVWQSQGRRSPALSALQSAGEDGQSQEHWVVDGLLGLVVGAAGGDSGDRLVSSH